MTSLVLACFLAAQPVVGFATVYGYPTDPQDDGYLACRAALERRRNWLQMVEAGCAHRTLPCGTRLLVRRRWGRGWLGTTCYVVDRGPYGLRGTGYRGLLDLRPGPAAALRITGRSPIFYRRN